MLNNMQHIRQEMSQFEEKLELQTFYDWLEAEQKLGTPFKEVVKNFSKSADEDIDNKMDHIMLEIAEKVGTNLYSNLIWVDIFAFLCSSLQTFNSLFTT